jgi:hypothetical protein
MRMDVTVASRRSHHKSAAPGERKSKNLPLKTPAGGTSRRRAALFSSQKRSAPGKIGEDMIEPSQRNPAATAMPTHVRGCPGMSGNVRPPKNRLNYEGLIETERMTQAKTAKQTQFCGKPRPGLE